MDPNARKQVLVIGSAEIDETEFNRRDLQVKRVTADEAPTYFKTAKAVVIADVPEKFGLIKEAFAGIFRQAEDHELLPVVLTHSLREFAQAGALRTKDHPASNAKIVQIAELWKAAELIARHRAGPPAGDVLLQPSTLALTNDAILLLKRAFADCVEIYVEPLLGGRASISVFRVHARLKQSVVGPRPLPFFVKIDEPSAIESEKGKYHYYAEHYIPFNLRPNLDKDRCVRTRACAALVGDFVDDAVPLRKCLRLGQGIGALFALFETSLKGFRLQPFAAGQKPRKSALKPFVEHEIRAGEMISEVVEQARRKFSLSRTPTEMQEIISRRAEKLACRMGPCHGDLHSGNVMVRGGDAILIDFSSVGDGPLTADPAALEVSLMFGTDEEDKPKTFDDWRAFADQIYSGNIRSLHPPALSESKPGPFSWLRRSIRELRHILLGCKVGEMEAKLVLAAYLMRYARLGKGALERADMVAFDRHVYALVVADRLVAGLTTKKP